MSRREAEISELQAALQEETNKTFQLSGELDATKTSMRLEISALLRKVRASCLFLLLETPLSP
jgi:hypothetical protein